MPKLNVLKLLSRSDKWYLGCGGPLVWTPPFPLWLDRPGFWDSASWYDYELGPLFTVTLLNEEGREIPLQASGRKWNPAFIEQKYEGRIQDSASHGGKGCRVQVTERKAVVEGKELVSEISLKNLSEKRLTLHLVAWAVQKRSSGENSGFSDTRVKRESIEFTRELKHRSRSPVALSCRLAIDGDSSCVIVQTEDSPMQPRWELTPLCERFEDGKFSGAPLSISDREGFVHMALVSPLQMKRGKEAKVCVTFRVESAEDKGRQVSRLKSQVPSKETSANPESLIPNFKPPIQQSLLSWNGFFSSVPSFECSDEFLTRYYWYRWYGLKLYSMEGREGNYTHPFICEGPRYFRGAITYSAQCHMLETRWINTPKFAHGSLRNFVDHQKQDGSFWGYIGFNGYYEGSFYHANWGKGALEVDRIHPDDSFLSRIYEGLIRYVDYFDRERDRERSGLYDVVNHFETGQEFMSRYMAVDPKADAEDWGKVFRMKGVDATVYIYELKKTLAEIALRLGKSSEEEQKWLDGAEKSKDAVLRRMWDPEQEIFFDVDPLTLKRTGVKAAICFYPYMTDLVDESHLAGLKRHLFNPNEFWTPYRVPATSADDPMFSAEGVWKGRRMNCPWNGRVWPMTNSHIAEALAQSAIRFRDDELRLRTAEFISKFIRMMFFDGDPNRPNCFEHYHPYKGTPSVYRGVDDYQHSWIVDLIIKYVAGLRPGKDSVVVDPFPFKLNSFMLDNAVIRGSRFRIHRKGEKISVFVNEKKVGESVVGEPIVVKL